MSKRIVRIYTDGSCHAEMKIGGWAVILLMDSKTITLTGVQPGTTHNRMELLAVIKAIEYVRQEFKDLKKIMVYTDSEYVINIRERKEKLKSNYFQTKKGNTIRNADLVQTLVRYMEVGPVCFTRITADQKESPVYSYHREADKIARRTVREEVRRIRLFSEGR